MIGDRLDTDIAGGINAKVGCTVLVPPLYYPILTYSEVSYDENAEMCSGNASTALKIFNDVESSIKSSITDIEQSSIPQSERNMIKSSANNSMSHDKDFPKFAKDIVNFNTTLNIYQLNYSKIYYVENACKVLKRGNSLIVRNNDDNILPDYVLNSVFDLEQILKIN